MFSFVYIILCISLYCILLRISIWLWSIVCVFSSIFFVCIPTCDYFSSDWWTICKLNREKGLTYTGGEISEETSCLDIPPPFLHLPSVLLQSWGQQGLALPFLWKEGLRKLRHRNVLGFGMRIELGWMGRGEERPILRIRGEDGEWTTDVKRTGTL